MEKYITFIKTGQSEVVSKKSRFIGQAFYVSSEDEVKEIIQSLKKKHYGANHNCFAYRLSGAVMIERQSDDGEPAGTAGLPILDVLRGQDILNALIVVTRYFGGTLLGTGGLVKAYGQAAKEAAAAAGTVLKEPYSKISVISDYGLSGKLEYEIKKSSACLGDILYTDSVEFQIYIPCREKNAFVNHLVDITNSNAVIEETGKIYGGVVNGKFQILE